MFIYWMCSRVIVSRSMFDGVASGMLGGGIWSQEAKSGRLSKQPAG